MNLKSLAVGIGLMLGLSHHQYARAQEMQERWFFLQTNLLPDTNVKKVTALFTQAHAAGYNGVVLEDSKFGRLGEMNSAYFNHVATVKAAAAANHLEIIPGLFSIGYSEDLLGHNPNLAEALPVRDQPYIVGDDSIARVAANKNLLPASFAKWDWHDDCVHIEEQGRVARVQEARNQNARIVSALALRPFTQYHLRVSVKTDHFNTRPEVKVLPKGSGQDLQYQSLDIAATQDWRTCDVVFNALESTQVNLYLGAWGAGAGQLAWRDVSLQEVGMVNLVRRVGAPLRVTTDDGTPLQEGRDFQPVADPRMGVIPWPGSYEVWHEGPVIKTLGLKSGTILHVSYYHAEVMAGGQVMICPSEPETLAELRDQARRVHAAFGAKRYFMNHDEIRCLNWDESCVHRHMTPGQILADNVHTCAEILRSVNPGGQVYVWSDMFDPNHNAHDHYYLVNGDYAGSWKGLEKDAHIVLWNSGTREKSMQFFHALGNPMMVAGFYDAPVQQLQDWLDDANKSGGVTGVMYTTWTGDFSQMAAFAKLAWGKP